MGIRFSVPMEISAKSIINTLEIKVHSGIFSALCISREDYEDLDWGFRIKTAVMAKALEQISERHFIQNLKEESPDYAKYVFRTLLIITYVYQMEGYDTMVAC